VTYALRPDLAVGYELFGSGSHPGLSMGVGPAHDEPGFLAISSDQTENGLSCEETD